MSRDWLESATVRWFFEFSEQGIFTTDDRLIIASWNRWLERHSGRTASEVVGRPLFDVYPDLVVRGLDEAYRHALSGRATLISNLLHKYLLPMTVRVGDATFMYMPQRARIAPLDEDGAVIGTLTVIDDVSERVASEAELRRQIEAQHLARSAAEKALRAKEEFLATLSHEIRTPLNAVLGWARILSERQVDPELLNRATASIFRNATVQARMIDDMLDTARIIAGKLRLQIQPVDLRTVAASALDVMTPAIDAKRIALRKSFGDDVPLVLGDPDRLQQIVWNVLSNSVKFTDSGGTVECRVVRQHGGARIEVTDTGRGIEPDLLPYIFERFRQGDAGAGRREGGLGLGLSLVRNLVQLHGGSVRASSPGVGKGSTFVIEFPAMTSAAQEALDKPRHADVSSLDGIHVLLVDDEEDARTLLTTVLSDRGGRVTSAASGDEALALLRGAPPGDRPHVLVTDLGMARGAAFELMAALRKQPPDAGGTIPAVAVSSEEVDDVRARAIAAGYQLQVRKPVDPAELIAAIRRAIRGADV